MACATSHHLKLVKCFSTNTHLTLNHFSKPTCLSLPLRHNFHLSLSQKSNLFVPFVSGSAEQELEVGETETETEIEIEAETETETETEVGFEETNDSFAEPPETEIEIEAETETETEIEIEAETEVGFEETNDSFAEPPEEAKLFVGNLPFDVDSNKLAELFNQAGVVEISEVIYNRQTDQSRGFGFVTMSTVEEAEKAVEMFNSYDIGGRLLTVNKAAPRGSQPERVPRNYGPSFRIYVGNLPWSADSERLEQVFSEYGKVVDAKVVFDRESGRSRGFGFVTMSSEEELNDAIAALDGQNLDGRAIRVNVAEEKPRRNSF